MVIIEVGITYGLQLTSHFEGLLHTRLGDLQMRLVLETVDEVRDEHAVHVAKVTFPREHGGHTELQEGGEG